MRKFAYFWQNALAPENPLEGERVSWICDCTKALFTCFHPPTSPHAENLLEFVPTPSPSPPPDSSFLPTPIPSPALSSRSSLPESLNPTTSLSDKIRIFAQERADFLLRKAEEAYVSRDLIKKNLLLQSLVHPLPSPCLTRRYQALLSNELSPSSLVNPVPPNRFCFFSCFPEEELPMNVTSLESRGRIQRKSMQQDDSLDFDLEVRLKEAAQKELDAELSLFLIQKLRKALSEKDLFEILFLEEQIRKRDLGPTLRQEYQEAATLKNKNATKIALQAIDQLSALVLTGSIREVSCFEKQIHLFLSEQKLVSEQVSQTFEQALQNKEGVYLHRLDGLKMAFLEESEQFKNFWSVDILANLQEIHLDVFSHLKEVRQSQASEDICREIYGAKQAIFNALFSRWKKAYTEKKISSLSHIETTLNQFFSAFYLELHQDPLFIKQWEELNPEKIRLAKRLLKKFKNDSWKLEPHLLRGHRQKAIEKLLDLITSPCEGLESQLQRAKETLTNMETAFRAMETWDASLGPRSLVTMTPEGKDLSSIFEHHEILKERVPHLRGFRKRVPSIGSHTNLSPR